jgi:small subunit ribosomal protein S17
MTGVIDRVQGKRKTKVGRVVSDRMDKTIVVSVERLARHPLYKRVIRLTTKFKAHDETNDARVGDTVLIEESRPLSATKRWRLVSIIQRAGEHGLPGEAVVGEEAAVTEAIHAAAHPGRTRTADADTEGATDDDSADDSTEIAARADSKTAAADPDAASGPADAEEGPDAAAQLSEDRGDATASHPSEEEAAS